MDHSGATAPKNGVNDFLVRSSGHELPLGTRRDQLIDDYNDNQSNSRSYVN